MSAKENKAVVRRYIEELWGAGKLAVADEVYADDCVAYSLNRDAKMEAPAPFKHGPEAIKQIVTEWRAAFPDFQETIEDLVAEGNKVAVWSTVRGTHTGRDFEGIPATGRKMTMAGIRIFRVSGGKIFEYWNLWDWQDLYRQLGKVAEAAD